MTYPYNANKTMKLLGKQSIAYIFDQHPEIKHQINEIAQARPYSFTLESSWDLFMLGYIYGKRADRARRKKNINL